MGWIRTILGLSSRDTAPAPRQMIGFPLDGGLSFGGVTPNTSLGLSAVWRCLDILASISQLEWRELRGNLELPASRIVTRPQADRTRREWVSLVVRTLALYDVCYLWKVGGYDGEGVPIGLAPLDPAIVTPKTTSFFGYTDPSEYLVGNLTIPADELVILRRFPTPCVNEALAGVINLARTTFAAALAAERYSSRYWQSGGSPTTVLETDAVIGQTKADEMSDRWAQRRSKGPDYAPVLEGGLKAKDFGADPTTASAVEARKEHVADVGRYFGIGTRQLNAPAGDSETYNTTEGEGINLVTYTLANYIGAISDAITDQLPGGRRVLIDVTPLTRGTQLTRAQSWAIATGSRPWMDPEEVRDAEGLPPREIVLPAIATAGESPAIAAGGARA